MTTATDEQPMTMIIEQSQPQPQPAASLASSGKPNRKLDLDHAHNVANPLVSLPPDALVSVLCRVPACSHDALWRSCRAIRRTLDSDSYASERAARGLAEVSARLVPGEELYDRDYPDGPEDVSISDDEDGPWNPDVDFDSDDDENLTEEELTRRDAKKERYRAKIQAQREEYLNTWYSDLGTYDSSYGYEGITVDITIDGVRSGSVMLVLIPRPWGGQLFHEAADAHSQELQEVGWTLCDCRGRPRVRSIKRADAADPVGNAGLGGFLHVKKVTIPQVYRPSDSTNVVSEAVSEALTVPELEGKWTLATAVSDGRVYMTKEEWKRMNDIRNEEQRSQAMGTNGTDDDADAADAAVRAEEKKKLDNRWDDCVTLDARTFLRVGFEQIPEVVGSNKNAPPWLFALPIFFEDPIMSYEEVMAIEMHRPPELPPKPTEANGELLETVKKACRARKGPMDTITLISNPTYIESMARQDDAKEARTVEDLQALETQIASLLPGSVPESVRSQMESLRSSVADVRRRHETTTFEERCAEKRNYLNNMKEVARNKIRERDEELKTTVVALVNENGASIRKSFVLHCSARFLISEYIDLLLDFVPTNERPAAINDIDTEGCTPLHCALMGTPEIGDADLYYQMVQHLLGRGASRDVVDTSGRTPLGQYRSVVSSRNDYINAYNLGAVNAERGDTMEAWQPIHERMEQALMPDRGETDADRDAKGEQNHYSSEDEMDIDEDDFDEDDSDEEGD